MVRALVMKNVYIPKMLKITDSGQNFQILQVNITTLSQCFASRVNFQSHDRGPRDDSIALAVSPAPIPVLRRTNFFTSNLQSFLNPALVLVIL